MNELETIVKTLGNEGALPEAIARELNARGFRDRRKMPFTEAIVEGYMRALGIGLVAPEYSAPPADPDPSVDIPGSGLPTEPAQTSPYSKDAEPIGEPLPKIRMLRPWPLHTEFSPDNLNLKGWE